MKERLHLPAAKPNNGPAPAKPAAKPAAETTKRHYDNVREFQLTDGRPIAVHRHCIRWACPLKNDPDRATLVATKEGAGPMPMAITYTAFMSWWLEKPKAER